MTRSPATRTPLQKLELNRLVAFCQRSIRRLARDLLSCLSPFIHTATGGGSLSLSVSIPNCFSLFKSPSKSYGGNSQQNGRYLALLIPSLPSRTQWGSRSKPRWRPFNVVKKPPKQSLTGSTAILFTSSILFHENASCCFSPRRV